MDTTPHPIGPGRLFTATLVFVRRRPLSLLGGLLAISLATTVGAGVLDPMPVIIAFVTNNNGN
jgi:hypothetical protein